jgi:hypothetical protein
MKKLILFWILAVVFTSANAQTTTTIKGTITDAKGTAVPAASVHLLNTNFSTSVNGKGVYVFSNVPSGKYNIEATGVGYASAVKVIDVTGASFEINFQLAASRSQLSEVVVSAQKRDEAAQPTRS